MKHYFLIRCSTWEWCVPPLLHGATLNQHLCKCADVYHTETDWRSDASERIHKPVEEIKSLWTALLTSVVEFCWHQISCLTFGSITGFIVVETLLEGCHNLKGIKWFMFCKALIKWGDSYQSPSTNLNAAMKKQKNNSPTREFIQFVNRVLLSNRLIQWFRSRSFCFNLNPRDFQCTAMQE